MIDKIIESITYLGIVTTIIAIFFTPIPFSYIALSWLAFFAVLPLIEIWRE